MKVLNRLFIISSFIFLNSCDPFGMSCIKNNSSDTLTITLKGVFKDSLSIRNDQYCSSFYSKIYYKNSLENNKDLWKWREIMDIYEPKLIGDSLLKISIPRNGIIITNYGLSATRLFKNCPYEFAVFEIGEKRDTLFDIKNFKSMDIKAFYERNNFNTIRVSKYPSVIWITEIIGIR